jgi:hypothetical protein
VENVHPHLLDNGRCALAHNGILDLPWTCEGASDTRIFCMTVLAHRPAEFLTSEDCRKWLEPLIGTNNKFVLMDCNGNVSIVNADSGHFDGSRWYSNHSHEASPYVCEPWHPRVFQGTGARGNVDRGTLFDDEEDGRRGNDADKLPAKYRDEEWEEREWQQAYLNNCLGQALDNGDSEEARNILAEISANGLLAEGP